MDWHTEFTEADEAKLVTCDQCGESKMCVFDDDPYTREINPEEPNPESYWCGRCYQQRSDDR